MTIIRGIYFHLGFGVGFEGTLHNEIILYIVSQAENRKFVFCTNPDICGRINTGLRVGVNDHGEL